VPSGGGDTTGSGSDVVLPIIVALVVLGAGAAYLLSRRNRPTSAT
jgi:LPXTG-motif cell wall-anchored protein